MWIWLCKYVCSDVHSSVCYQLGSVGISDSIPCKTHLKVFVKSTHSFPYVVLFVWHRTRKRHSKTSRHQSYIGTQIQTHPIYMLKTRKQLHRERRCTESSQTRAPSWLNYSKANALISFLNVISVHSSDSGFTPNVLKPMKLKCLCFY